MYEISGTGGPSGLENLGITQLDGRAVALSLKYFLASPAGEKKFIQVRKDLHQNPELGREEFRTTERICAVLKGAGLKPRKLRGGTGVICRFGPKGRAGAMALRAELDALPLREETNARYRSLVPDRAHACGHDVHMATVLGAGLYLAELHRLGLLPGEVVLIFEPAEEQVPCGAVDVIEEGGLEGVEQIFAVHAWPHLPEGTFGLHVGPVTAACDMFNIWATGPGGHTSRPHLTADLVVALASLVVNSAAAVPRRFDVRNGLVLGFGRIEAGDAPNRVPGHGLVEGTVRYLNNKVGAEAPEFIRAVAMGVAESYGPKMEFKVDYRHGMPATMNDAVSIQHVETAVTALVGPNSVVHGVDSLGGDSMGKYTEHVRGAYVWAGTNNKKALQEGNYPDLHSGKFLPGHGVIAHSIKALAGAVLVGQGVEL